MPLTCKAVILADQLSEPELVFNSWMDDVFTHDLARGIAFAHTDDSPGPCIDPMAGPGVWSTKPKLTSGAFTIESSIIHCFAADGEGIRSGRSSCQIDSLTSKR